MELADQLSKKEFTNASLKGTHAVAISGQGGYAPTAGVGMLTFDGKGNVSGFQLLNLPGFSFGERTLVKSCLKGTYTVDKDGFGSGTTKITLPDGSNRETSFVLGIGKAKADRVAEEVFFILQDLEPTTGNLITFITNKLIDEGEFSPASLKGTFSFNGITKGGQIFNAGIGLITFDGKGKYSGADTLNIPGNSFDQRKITKSPFEGTYQMIEGGIYSAISTPSQSEAIFLITKAKIVNGIKVAQEYFYIVPSNNLEVTGGNFVISIGKSLSD
jgi:hypothetical protein